MNETFVSSQMRFVLLRFHCGMSVAHSFRHLMDKWHRIGYYYLTPFGDTIYPEYAVEPAQSDTCITILIRHNLWTQMRVLLYSGIRHSFGYENCRIGKVNISVHLTFNSEYIHGSCNGAIELSSILLLLLTYF